MNAVTDHLYDIVVTYAIRTGTKSYKYQGTRETANARVRKDTAKANCIDIQVSHGPYALHMTRDAKTHAWIKEVQELMPS